MTYKEWVQTLNTARYTKHEYYSTIVKYKKDIILAVEETNQMTVSNQLNMPQPVLGAMLKILKVL